MQDRELPDPARDPDVFAHVMLGIDWVEDIQLQVFCCHVNMGTPIPISMVDMGGTPL